MAKQKPTKAQVAYGKARAGGNDPMRITAKEVKRTAKGVVKTAALIATVAGPGKVVKGAKVATKGAKAVRDVVRGKKTYYHGSPKEIAEGATLKSSRAKGASATNKKKLAKEYASKKLTLTSEGVKKSPTGGNVYKVKSKSGKVTQTGKFGKAKEFNANDFIVIKKVK
jgi:hypothetical protein